MKNTLLALHLYPMSLLLFSHFEHDLCAHEKRATCPSKKHNAGRTANNPFKQSFQPVQAKSKAHQVRGHHHKNVAHSANAAQIPVRIWAIAPFPSWEEQRCYDLRKYEERNEPAPHQQPKIDIMPQRDKSKDSQKVHNRSDSRKLTSRTAATEGNVDVPHDPAIQGTMPATPESEGGVVVAHAADHVLWRIDAIEQRPEAKEAPGDEELEPDDVEVEVAEHTELGRGVY